MMHNNILYNARWWVVGPCYWELCLNVVYIIIIIICADIGSLLFNAGQAWKHGLCNYYEVLYWVCAIFIIGALGLPGLF